MSMRTVGELRVRLEEYSDDMQLKVALQPTYPMSATLKGVVASEDLTDEEDGKTLNPAVWLVVNSQDDYEALSCMWDAAY